jgi:hypothetical protein
MPASQRHLILVAGVCLIFGMLLIGMPVGVSNQLRFFLGGIFVGSGILAILLGHQTWPK